VHLKDLSPKT